LFKSEKVFIQDPLLRNTPPTFQKVKKNELDYL